MPFGQTSEAHTADYWSEHFEDFIKPAVERAAKDGKTLGYDAVIIRNEPGAIVSNVFRSLQSAEVVLADITDSNPNVLYELGIRHTLGRKTILVIEQGQRIPFYFNGFTVVGYSKQSATNINNFYKTIEKYLIELSKDRPDSVPDNPVEAFFQGERQKVALLSELQERTISEMNEHHLSALYTPHLNSNRNERKVHVISTSQSLIRLIAHTGHAYLAEVGHQFKAVLTERLKKHIKTQIILLNPWTDGGLLIALGEMTDQRTSEMTSNQRIAFEKLEQGQLSGFDPVPIVEESLSFQKLGESLKGYKRDFAVGSLASSFELRFYSLQLTSTVLLTDAGGFFEPYIDVNLPERWLKRMQTFEIEFDSQSYLAEIAQAYFDQLWKLSIPYEEFVVREQDFKKRLRIKYKK
jgi:hypothetical protein